MNLEEIHNRVLQLATHNFDLDTRQYNADHVVDKISQLILGSKRPNDVFDLLLLFDRYLSVNLYASFGRHVIGFDDNKLVFQVCVSSLDTNIYNLLDLIHDEFGFGSAQIKLFDQILIELDAFYE